MNTQERLETIKDIQHVLAGAHLYTGKIDGDFGTLSKAALAALLLPAAPDTQPEPPVIAVPPKGLMDARSEATIATLIPQVRQAFRELGLAICQAIAPHSWKWISGYRGEAEQNALYAQGRTASGPIVTGAKFPHSAHNSGVAADGGVFTAQGDYRDEGPQYDVAGSLSRGAGFHWGADFGDRPHHCKRPPSLDSMKEAAFISTMIYRLQNGISLWP